MRSPKNTGGSYPRMAAFQNLSIKSKIRSVVMLTSCIALMTACAAIVAYEWFGFRTNLVLEISSLAEITAKNLWVPVSYDHPEEAENTLANLSIERQIQSACVFKDGKIWARYPKNLPDTAFPQKPAVGTHRFDQNSLVLSRTILHP